MKNYIYIVTKDGKIYTEEGVQFILHELFGDHSNNNSVIEMGDTYNSPLILKRNILKHPANSYIIISNPSNILCIRREDDIKEVAEMLGNNETANSWDILNQFIKRDL